MASVERGHTAVRHASLSFSSGDSPLGGYESRHSLSPANLFTSTAMMPVRWTGKRGYTRVSPSVPVAVQPLKIVRERAHRPFKRSPSRPSLLRNSAVFLASLDDIAEWVGQTCFP